MASSDQTAPGVVVIGAGPAGLMAGLHAARSGARTRVLAKGWGVLHWHAGCIDVLGYDPANGELVESPRAALARLIADRPDHPYALVGEQAAIDALDDLMLLCADAGYPLEGSIDHNHLIPTGVGGARPTCLVPATMTAGDLRRNDPAVVVGLEGFLDLTARLVADNLERRGVPCRPITLDLPSLRARKFINAPVLATLFETEELRSELVAALAPKTGRSTRIGFPAVLGIDQATDVVADLRERLGADVFEIPIVPPSVPGIRLHHILTGAIRAAGGRVFDGMEATAVEAGDGHLAAVLTEAAARRHRTPADAFVLATGGILGGGIVGDEDGRLREVVCDLPVSGPDQRGGWLRRDFTDSDGHPVYRAGLLVDAALRPVDDRGRPVYDNVHAAGGALAGAEAIRERSIDGIAFATGRRAGLAAVEGARNRSEETITP